tara:strand:- start:11 stop:226 length:216 start_codon:yes stop_codon:yes gene_type:complete
MNNNFEDIVDTVVRKIEDGVDWIDSIPSVPAAFGGLVVGLLIPMKPWLVIIGVGVVYAAIKIHSHLSSKDN